MSYPHRLNARVSAQQAQMQKHAEPNALFTGETSSGALSQSQLTFNRISRYVSYDKQTTILIFIWLLRQNPQQVCWLYYLLSETLDIDIKKQSQAPKIGEEYPSHSDTYELSSQPHSHMNLTSRALSPHRMERGRGMSPAPIELNVLVSQSTETDDSMYRNRDMPLYPPQKPDSF